MAEAKDGWRRMRQEDACKGDRRRNDEEVAKAVGSGNITSPRRNQQEEKIGA